MRSLPHRPMKQIFAVSSLVFALTGTVLGQPKIRIVSCDATVQSYKRGICANHLDPADFPALEKGISWWYSWHYAQTDPSPVGTTMQFAPMVWGDRPESLVGLEKQLKLRKPRFVMAINEPNLKDQAFIPPKQTADLYRRVKAIADKYHVPVCGPHMALGSAKEASITAYDPIDKKPVTYTWMVPFLKAFLEYSQGTDVSATSLHAYGDINELRWAIDTLHKEFNRPVWVTEFAHAPDPASGLTYLMQAVDLLERTPYIEGYAWFKERINDPKWQISLLAPEPGKLTALGKTYVAMPVHEADLYYRLPGRLGAERYTKMTGTEIWPTRDQSGFADMAAVQPKATLTYNVFTPKAATYTIQLRVSGAAGSIILRSGEDSTTATTTGTEWQTLTVQLKLPVGAQSIEVELSEKGQTLHWLEVK